VTLEHANRERTRPGRVIVLGAGGFVGGAIVRRLAGDGVEHVAVTRQECDLLAPSAGRRLGELLDADDRLVVVSAIAPVRNAAQFGQNIRMAEAVGEALAARPLRHLVYISSDAVYADEANPVTEASCAAPSSLHGMMHAARELLFRSATRAPVCVLRPSLLYGAGDPHNGYGPNRFRRQVARGEPIALFGEGEEQRDHVFIDDVAAIVALVLGHGSRGVLNIATGVSTSFRRVAEMVARLAPRPGEIKGSARQSPITHRHFDITACLKAFPRFRYTPLAEGLRLAAEEK
jgi:UDP-glucose 4-epimerase